MKPLTTALLQGLRKSIKDTETDKALACVRTKKQIILSNGHWLLAWPLKLLADDIPAEMIEKLEEVYEKNSAIYNKIKDDWRETIFPNILVQWECDELDPTKYELRHKVNKIHIPLVSFEGQNKLKSTFKRIYVDAMYDICEDISFKICERYGIGYLVVYEGGELVGGISPRRNT
jgi:hypothetical protein